MIETLDKKTRTLLIVIMYNILFTNDVAMSYVFSTIEELEKLKMFKGSIKYRTGFVRKAMREYNAKISKKIKNLTYFLADVNDILDENLKMDFMKLENVVRMELQRNHVPNIELMTKMSIAHTMCETALLNCDSSIDTQEQNVRFYARTMRDFKITGVSESFFNLCNLIQKENEKGCEYDCDLSQNNDVSNGFLIIIQKLKSGEFIFDILKKIDSTQNLEY